MEVFGACHPHTARSVLACITEANVSWHASDELGTVGGSGPHKLDESPVIVKQAVLIGICGDLDMVFLGMLVVVNLFVQGCQKASTCGNCKGQVLQFSEHGLELRVGAVLMAEGAGDGVHKLGDFGWGEFNGPSNSIKDPAQEFLASAQMPSPSSSFLMEMDSPPVLVMEAGGNTE